MRKQTTALLAAALALLGCERPYAVAEPEVLAADAHFILADRRLVLPVVAVKDVSPFWARDEFDHDDAERRLHEATRDPASPYRTGSLEVRIADYGSHGETLASAPTCPLLSRAWSRRVCVGERPGLLKDAPETFQLLDHANLSQVGEFSVAGSNAPPVQVAEEGAGGEPGLLCDARSGICRATLTLTPRIVAVWSVWADPDTGENVARVAKRQGAAIAAFLRAVGERDGSAALVGSSPGL